MRAFSLVAWLCLLFVREANADACSAVTGNIRAFTAKLLAKLTSSKFFTVTDSVVCQIANDTATWSGQGITMPNLVKNLIANSGSYESTVIATKMDMASYLLNFISCASNCGEKSWTAFMQGTVLFSMQKFMKKPYKKCVTSKVPTYIKNAVGLPERCDKVSKCGAACITTKLIKKIVKLTMKRSCACTWTSCVKPLITAGVLNITPYLPAKGAALLLAKCPSKSA